MGANCNYTLTFICLVGLGLSIYGYMVDLELENNADYTAMCDISPHMSCSKAFKSVYGKGFGLFSEESPFNQPNSLLGIVFYSLSATLGKLSYWGWMLANLSSLYFAYILYFKLYDFCIVCVSIYVVNLLGLIVTNWKVRALSTEEKKKRV